jgi:hypothetical protein
MKLLLIICILILIYFNCIREYRIEGMVARASKRFDRIISSGSRKMSRAKAAFGLTAKMRKAGQEDLLKKMMKKRAGMDNLEDVGDGIVTRARSNISVNNVDLKKIEVHKKVAASKGTRGKKGAIISHSDGLNTIVNLKKIPTKTIPPKQILKSMNDNPLIKNADKLAKEAADKADKLAKEAAEEATDASIRKLRKNVVKSAILIGGVTAGGIALSDKLEEDERQEQLQRAKNAKDLEITEADYKDYMNPNDPYYSFSEIESNVVNGPYGEFNPNDPYDPNNPNYVYDPNDPYDPNNPNYVYDPDDPNDPKNIKIINNNGTDDNVISEINKEVKSNYLMYSIIGIFLLLVVVFLYFNSKG